MQLIQLEENAPDPLIGAGCTLGAAEIKVRLRERAELRDRSTDIRDVAGGVAIGLDADEPIDRVADLAGRESECCAFYTFVLRIEGERRELEISAGEGARLRCGFCSASRRPRRETWMGCNETRGGDCSRRRCC